MSSASPLGRAASCVSPWLTPNRLGIVLEPVGQFLDRNPGVRDSDCHDDQIGLRHEQVEPLAVEPSLHGPGRRSLFGIDESVVLDEAMPKNCCSQDWVGLKHAPE